MEDDRKLTIINEIKYWKQHKLLPEHYCNFLLALYTGGEGVPETDNVNEREKVPFRYLRKVERFQVVLLYLLLPFSFIVIYFTEFHIYLQLVILVLLLSYSVWMGIYYKGKRHLISHSALIISLFLILSLTIIITAFIVDSSFGLAMTITVNFILWVSLGFAYRLKYLTITGGLGIIFVFIYHFL